MRTTQTVWLCLRIRMSYSGACRLKTANFLGPGLSCITMGQILKAKATVIRARIPPLACGLMNPLMWDSTILIPNQSSSLENSMEEIIWHISTIFHSATPLTISGHPVFLPRTIMPVVRVTPMGTKATPSMVSLGLGILNSRPPGCLDRFSVRT